MNTCPNRTSPEWVVLSKAVGELEAMRDYMESGEEIRTPNEVLSKLELRGRIPKTILTKRSPIDQETLFRSNLPGSMSEKKAIELIDNLRREYPDLNFTYYFGEAFEEKNVTITADIKDGAQQTYDYFLKIAQDADSLLRLDPTEEAQYFRDKLQNDSFENETTKYRENPEAYETLDLANEGYSRLVQEGPISLDPSEIDRTEALDAITQLANQVSSQLGVPFEMITTEQAVRLTSGRKNSWSGEAAFFLDGKAYFVGDKLTKEMVFHEFAHPLIKAIKVQNIDLFYSLYDKLVETKEGQALYERVKALYPELSIDSDNFKEELIVTALAQQADVSEDKKSAGFIKFIKDLLFAIKQQLRKLFGVKIKVEDLNENTSLSQLAAMLKGDRFNLVLSSQPTEEGIVNYARDLSSAVDNIARVSDEKIMDSINVLFETSINWLSKIENEKNYEFMKDILVEEFKAGELPRMVKDLGEYQTVLNTRIGKVKGDMEFTRARLEALVSSLSRMQKMSVMIHNELIDITKDLDNKDNLSTTIYLGKILDSWKETIVSIRTGLTKEGVLAGSPMFRLLDDINTQIEQSKIYSNEVYTQGMTDLIHTQVKPMGDAIEKKYTELLDFWTKKRDEALASVKSPKGAQSMIDSYTKEYNAIKKNLTPEGIKGLLKGDLGDAGYMNSMFEGYLYNQDPIISGFSMFVNNGMTDAMTKAHDKLNSFSLEMKKLLEDAGYTSHTDIAKLGRLLTFIDKTGILNKDTGLFEMKEVRTFLNPFKDYRHDIEKFHYDLKKAKEKFLETNADQDYKDYIKLLREFKKHLKDYFHQEYKNEFYETEDLFLKDDIGMMAKDKRDEILDKVKRLDIRYGNSEDEDITNEIDAEWKKYRQLYSLLDLSGKKKTGDDLLIAQRLREHRELSREFYEWKERTGIFDAALRDFEDSLVTKKLAKGSIEYEQKRQDWITNNTRKIIKPEFFVYRNILLAELKDLLKDLPSTKADQVTMDEAYSDIFDSMSGYKDEDGQPKGSEIPEGRMDKIRERQLQLVKLRESWASFTGLTREEMNFVNDYFNRIDSAKEGYGSYPSPADKERVIELLAKKDKLGLSPLKKRRVNAILAKLNALQSKEATDYYLDVVNNFLDTMDGSMLTKMFGSTNIDKVSAEKLTNYNAAQKLMDESPEFKTWFLKNHIERTKFDRDLGDNITVYERLYAWSATVPTDKKFYETTDIKDQDGNVLETIAAKPTFKYYTRIVKPEWYNKRIPAGYSSVTGKFEVGTVDNLGKRGYWLPKTVAQGAVDDRYINEEYTKLEADPKMHAVLTKIIEYHLANQDGVSAQGKLFLDIPRFRMSNLETLSTWNKSNNPLKNFGKQVRDFWVRAKDDQSLGYKPEEDDWQQVSADVYDPQTNDNIPIEGVYDLDVDQVSLDILTNVSRYMLSGEIQKKLLEMNPIAQALKQTLRDPVTGLHNSVKILQETRKGNMLNRTITKAIRIKKGEDNYRAKAIDNIYESHFLNIKHKGALANYKGLNQASSLMFGAASVGFFALNIPSALKNSFGQMFQSGIEAAAGEFMNPKTYAMGTGWALKAMGILSTEIYNKGPKSLSGQMIEYFDPSLGRSEDKFGTSMSRTMAKDIASMSWLYNVRKWVELHATMSAFAGIMYKQRVEQTDKDGNVKEIPYMEAFELKDGKMVLKEGIDPEWGIGGTKFKNVRNTIHEVNRRLNGVYDKFNQPEAQRYLLFRFTSYLNRYFIAMFVNRWGFRGGLGKPAIPRYNIATNDVTEGYYITMIKALSRGIKSRGQSLAAATPTEKRAFMKVTAEVAGLVIISMLMRVLFSWDPDDDERYAKLRDKSGALPFPFVKDDPDHPFNLGGYLENHGLNLLMQIKAENDQWLPVPGLGLDDYQKRLNVTSVAFSPTIQAYGDMITDVYHWTMGDPSAFYKRDVGPYQWQHEGGSKFWAHLAKSMGFTGSSVDPVKAIKDFQSIQARNK